MILTDVDGVLLNWTQGFKTFLRAHQIPVSGNDPKDWDLSSWILAPHNANQLIMEFNSSPAFKKLKPVYGVKKHLLALAEDYPIIAISCCGIRSHSMRLENLTNVFGDLFHDVVCLDLGQSKHAALSIYPTNSWWIEDNFDHAEMGANLGHRSLLLHRTYNKDRAHQGVTRVDNWAHITKVIRGSGV